MKKLFLMVVAALMAIGASAQTTVKMIRVYEGNTVVYEQQYAAVDSVVFFDKTISTPSETEGALPGEFSVSANKKVKFSKGNLQYNNSTWQFTEYQWDRPTSYNTVGKDVFAWGTGDDPAKTSTTADYSTFHDWGANPISNGGNEANMWRTPTKDEWVYLFHDRTNATKLFGFGSVKGINGVIILPDNWVTPEGASFTPNTMSWVIAYQGDERGYFYGGTSSQDLYLKNTYDEAQWLTMQAHGAVFLPADLNAGEWLGAYWSATPYGSGYAYSLDFGKNYLYPQYVYTNANNISQRYTTRAERRV